MVLAFDFKETILLFINPDADVLELDLGSLAMVLKRDPSLGGRILLITIRQFGEDYTIDLLDQGGTFSDDHQIIPAIFLVGRLHLVGIRHFLDALGSVLGINCFLPGKG